jgi:hypothetical protein
MCVILQRRFEPQSEDKTRDSRAAHEEGSGIGQRLDSKSFGDPRGEYAVKVSPAWEQESG